MPLGRVWRKALGGEHCEYALAAAEVTTLLDLRRALRNGTVWVEHSLASRSRETLFIPQRQREERRRQQRTRRHEKPRLHRLENGDVHRRFLASPR